MNRTAQVAITSSRDSARTRGSALAAALAAFLLAVVASAISLPARAEAAAPPRDFMGVTAWDDIGDRDFAKLAGSNVRLYRMDVLWNKVEPRPPRADGTHAYDWRYYDRMFRTAARHGVRILPVLQGSPRWAASRPQIQPRTTVGKAAFAAFAREAGKRYGPTGTLWTRTPWSRTSPAPSRLRALYWQVWNEPNTPDRWTPGPRPGEYATMLKRVSKALNGASPSVQVMSGGLVWPSRGMNPEPFLAHVLQVPGAREAVDVVAVHPYGKITFNVMQRVRSARGTLNSYGAASKSMWVTEMGWGSGTYDGQFTVPPDKQARNLDELYRELLSVRRSYKLLGATWFAYRDYRRRPDQAYYWGYYAGLLRADGGEKPAWRVFSRRARYGY